MEFGLPISGFRMACTRSGRGGDRTVTQSGLTLIELLIVMTIMVLLVGATIPVLSPPGDERKLREASRGINTFISGAQARAVQTGRPVGVMFKRLSEQTGDADDRAVCLELIYVQAPAPYAGLETSSRVMISQPNPAQPIVALRFVASKPIEGGAVAGLPAGLQGDLLPPEAFAPGDLVEVGGVAYRLLSQQAAGVGNCGPNTDLNGDGLLNDEYFTPPTDVPPVIGATPVDPASPNLALVYDNQGQLVVDVLSFGADTSTAPFWTEPKRYTLERQPLAGTVSALSSAPYQLPEGMAIDLRASGVDGVFFQKDEETLIEKVSNDLGPVVMFSPNGSLDNAMVGVDVGSNNANPTADGDPPDIRQPVTISDAVYLCIGLRENIPAARSNAGAEFVDFSAFSGSNSELDAAKAKLNWLNGESRWVIAGASGSVVTAPNGFVNPVLLARDNPGLLLHELRDLEIRTAREFAADRSKEGGL